MLKTSHVGGSDDVCNCVLFILGGLFRLPELIFLKNYLLIYKIKKNGVKSI